MSLLEWSSVAHTVEYAGLVLSVTVNSTLAFLILTKSRKGLGSYKYLMLSFAFFGIFFSLVDAFTEPTIHTYGTTFMVFTILSKYGLTKTQGAVSCALYCSCFCMTLALLAIHFLYRYFAVCKQDGLRLFKGYNIFIWPVVVIFLGSDWGLTSFFLEGETTESSEYVNATIWEHFALRMDEIGYVGPHYFVHNEKGERVYNWPSCIGMVNLLKIMGMSFSVVFYCGISTSLAMKEHGETKTQRTRELQAQLFRALVVQTMIPVVFMYLPVGILFISPFFEVELGAPTSFVAITLALYPVLDPMAVIFFIQDYRKALLRGLCGCFCKTRPNQHSTTISSTVRNTL
ncbi:unnamed protein product [Caenorhabditis auriculariae]|uniref:Serpentine receptor class r-10 n=1 Tax=Caenorhabditis auriculariae TaxID=2777116 RepID=A0A8S1GU82_9PELO|nr:unnamed protein product [Caenorhabditis auriculariae]